MTVAVQVAPVLLVTAVAPVVRVGALALRVSHRLRLRLRLFVRASPPGAADSDQRQPTMEERAGLMQTCGTWS